MSALSTSRRSLPFWLVRGIRSLLLFSLVLFLLMAGLGIWMSSKKQGGFSALVQLSVEYLSQKADFRLKSIVLKGNQRATKERLLDALALDLGETLTSIDLAGAQRRIDAVEWVASSSLRRILPSTLEVRLQEEEAFAFWQRKGNLHLVNEEGEAFLDMGPVDSSDFDRRENLKDFASLPYLVGVGALDEGIALLKALDPHPFLQDMMQAAVRVGERRWDLHLGNDIRVRLPEDGMHQALSRLRHLYVEYDIFNRDIFAIDLRLPDRIGFRLGVDAVTPDVNEPNSASQISENIVPLVKLRGRDG